MHVAIYCNVAILAAKLGVWAVSGSQSILAEAIHSLADLANQYLLRTGLSSSKRPPDEFSGAIVFPLCPPPPPRLVSLTQTQSRVADYGYRRELFVWSLISGVGIFCLGAGVSVVHGLHGLVSPQPVEELWASLSVIGLSLVIESYSLGVAYRGLAAGAAARNMRLRAYVRAGLDPTTIAVAAEDGGAVLGLALAGGCLAAAGCAAWGQNIRDPIVNFLCFSVLLPFSLSLDWIFARPGARATPRSTRRVRLRWARCWELQPRG